MIIQHIGIIPDGNRRWAKENGCSLDKTYLFFIKHICSIITKINTLKIPEISIYLMSKDNFQKRKSDDVAPVVEAIDIFLSNMLIPVINSTNAKIRCIGDYHLLNETTCSLIDNIEMKTAANNGLLINLLIVYDPFDEIKISFKNTYTFNINNLEISRKVDLVIRTGGGPVRLSNFLPLQCAYAALYQIDDYFLDFKIEKIEEIINSFSEIQMRYGG